jgi:hypothetical protein
MYICVEVGTFKRSNLLPVGKAESWVNMHVGSIAAKDD